MRKVILCASLSLDYTSAAAAGELGIASYYQNPHYQWTDRSPQNSPVWNASEGAQSRQRPSAIVKIVDRGPFIRGRIIDVSPAAASALGFREAGLAHVRIERTLKSTSERRGG